MPDAVPVSWDPDKHSDDLDATSSQTDTLSGGPIKTKSAPVRSSA
jgi:hypothetical protein